MGQYKQITQAQKHSVVHMRCIDCQKKTMRRRVELIRRFAPKCMACGGSLEAIGKLKKETAPENEEPKRHHYECLFCEKTFRNPAALELHEKEHNKL